MMWDNFYDVVIEGQCGNWKIEKQPSDKSVFLFDTTRNFTWMVNSEFEIMAESSLKMNPTGNMLMAGLGIGYEAFFLKERPEIAKITIVEREPEIIELTTRYLRHDKIHVVNDKVLHFLNTTTDKFDFVYFDIFHDSPAEFMFPRETAILKQATKRVLTEGGRTGFWNKYPLLDL